VTPLSERWQRVAIQQAAGIAKSWRTNRANAYQDYRDALAEYKEQEAGAQEPEWREWDVPTLQQTCIQANANVVKCKPSHDSTFDYWLTISTLAFRQQLFVPVKLSNYHIEVLTDPKTGKRRTINSSVTLNKRDGAWWLTLSYDEMVTVQTPPDAPVIGIDVGIANFITTSDGKQYGTFNGKLRERQKRDRGKRRRKAKLRKCLEKKGVGTAIHDGGQFGLLSQSLDKALNSPYPALIQELSLLPISSSEDSYGCSCVFVLARALPPLSDTAVVSWLAPSTAFAFKNRSSAHQGATASQAPLST